MNRGERTASAKKPPEKETPREKTTYERFRDHPRSQRFLVKFQEFMKLGLTPDSIAFCISVGMVVGVFPIFGITTLIAAVLALIFRLNMPLIQAVNYLMTPLHVLMILPWIRIGEHLFHRPHGPLTAAEILVLIQNKPWEALDAIGWDILRAVGAWTLAAPFLIAFLYWALKPLCRRIAKGNS